MNTKMVLISKDKSLINGLKYSLEEDDYIVEIAYNIKEATEKVKENAYDLVVMDIVLPDGNGMNLCRYIRENSQVPIVALTEEDEDLNKILALENGADDYMTKPLNISIFKAKLMSLLRRVKMKDCEHCDNCDSNNQSIVIDDFTINTVGRRLTINGNTNVTLTGKEFDLFYLLVTNSERVFTREELLKSIWGYDYYGDLRTVDVHIRRLREKIEDDSSNTEYIHTKWREGYYYKSKKANVASD